ncbi:MAG: energy transducer TonB [Acidobacteria bacterium]|nr:energy transducer TonB [Acidobacteriota bacterium]
MANQVVIPRSPVPDFDFRPLSDRLEEPWWRTVRENLRAALLRSNEPPLNLTSRPVKVRNIWGDYDYKKPAGVWSVLLHAAAIGGLVYISIAGTKVAIQKKAPVLDAVLIAPPAALYTPAAAPAAGKSGGGGGGGDHDKLQAPKGRLPKQDMEQFTPPAMVLHNDHPVLPREPSVVMPPTVRIADNHLPNLGDPMARIPSGPPSNGTGSGGGIGSGSGGGVGSGEGPGVGPGRGGGFGGGVFSVGGGVSAPRGIYMPDPDYSEEARKAKYQGVVTLWLIVDQNGRPRDIKVSRSLGMGLDQKAIEAVRNWKFEPAKKDGQPVAVQINVEVNFHLY